MLKRRTFLGGVALTGLLALDRAAFAAGDQYSYDVFGRLVRVEMADGTVVTYSYDDAGNRTQVVTTQGTPTPTPTPTPSTIQITGTGPKNLRSLANAAGYAGETDASLTFEVGTGITVMGTGGTSGGAGGIAIDTGTWPGGVSLTLRVKSGGKVHGGGGAGGTGGTGSSPSGGSGGAGGDAIYCRVPVAIEVLSGGEVKAGGGGGKGGEYTLHVYPKPTVAYPGGGGGGGAPNGAGGFSSGLGNPGSSGTTSGGGNGGFTANPDDLSGDGTGKTGGGFGQAGGGPGGAAGYAIRKNGFTVPVSNSGTIVGTQT